VRVVPNMQCHCHQAGGVPEGFYCVWSSFLRCARFLAMPASLYLTAVQRRGPRKHCMHDAGVWISTAVCQDVTGNSGTLRRHTRRSAPEGRDTRTWGLANALPGRWVLAERQRGAWFVPEMTISPLWVSKAAEPEKGPALARGHDEMNGS
jgi:hypothetical protein